MKQNILLFILILLISGCSQKEIEPSFSLQEETSSITLASAASSQTVIRFTSTREWKASTSSEWLLISPTSGEAGTYQMALTASSKNNSKYGYGKFSFCRPHPIVYRYTIACRICGIGTDSVLYRSARRLTTNQVHHQSQH